MNIETKELKYEYSDYLKFGWKHTSDRHDRVGRTYYTIHILARDKDMPNYDSIVALEKKYFSLKSQLKHYEPLDPLYGLIAFVCLILPFIIYVAIKSQEKKDKKAHNDKNQKQMEGVIKEVQSLF